MAQFIKTIQNFAFQYDLWEKGSKIVVGVSGGPDSTCLLDVFYALAKKYDLELHIAHVNYALRGEDSLKDELLVRKLAKKYNLELSILKPKKSQYKGNLESTLRDIRYAFFESIRQQLDFDLIAVAHNSDDKAETVLMRIIRGSGLNGLATMRPKVGKIIRPLLETEKTEILQYLKAAKLEYRIDKSNSNIAFARNNIRHNLLPYLEKNYNPNIKKTLNNWSMAVADDYAYIQEKAERFVRGICKNKVVHLNAKTFLAEHVSIQRQVLRVIYKQLKGRTDNLENQHIAEMLKVIKSTKNKAPKARIGGLNILKKGDKIEIFS